MTAWASFYSRVTPYVPGCPAPQVDLALLDASREFCLRTKAWVNQAAAVEGNGSTRAFNLVLPAGAELVEIRRATVAGEDWTVLSSREMPADWAESSPDTTQLTDTLVVKNDNTGFVLWPAPASGDDIVIYQALMPTLTATGVGDIIYTEFAEAIAAGAKYRLMTMPGKPWSITQGPQAQLAYDKFEADIHTAANRVFRQGQRRVRKSIV